LAVRNRQGDQFGLCGSVNDALPADSALAQQRADVIVQAAD
jgi:hypothetical protein